MDYFSSLLYNYMLREIKTILINYCHKSYCLDFSCCINIRERKIEIKNRGLKSNHVYFIYCLDFSHCINIREKKIEDQNPTMFILKNKLLWTHISLCFVLSNAKKVIRFILINLLHVIFHGLNISLVPALSPNFDICLCIFFFGIDPCTL